jgi:hypothetical protein
VGADHDANIITAIMTTPKRENFGEHLKMLIDNAIIYYITEFKHSENSIFRYTALTNIRRKYIYIYIYIYTSIYIFQVCTVGQKE